MRECLHELLIDPQRQGDRFGALRTQPAHHHAQRVLAVDRHAMDRVEGVGQAEAGLVVPLGERASLGDASSFGSKSDERWLHPRRPEKRVSRHSVGRRHVFLHQRGGQGEDVADVIEPVPRIVLREVVRWTDVHTEKLFDRVVVFGAIQPPRRDTPRSCSRHG